MSLYTTEVRYICEKAAGYDESQGFGEVNKILDAAWDKVIPQDWEIFDEEYRPVLCKKILKHYYTREIGLETVGLWQLKLETKLAEIMPYYNELYRTKLLQYDPFRDVDYYTEHEGADAGESAETTSGQRATQNIDNKTLSRTDNNSSTFQRAGAGSRETQEAITDANTKWDKYSDTPQGPLDWQDGQGQWHNPVEQFEYLTNARQVTDSGNENRSGNESKTENESGNSQDARTISEMAGDTASGNETTSGTGNKNFSNTNEYITHIYGKMSVKSYMSLIKEVRDIIINIDMMIIDDLAELFMMLWR